MYLCIRCGYKAQFRINKLAKLCQASRAVYGQENVEKARLGTLSRVSKSSLSSLPSHSLQLQDSTEPLRPHEAEAIRGIEAQMRDVPIPHQIAVPSGSELSSGSPSSDSEQSNVAPEGKDTDSGSE